MIWSKYDCIRAVQLKCPCQWFSVFFLVLWGHQQRNIEVCCEKKGRNVMDIDGFSCERELHEVKQGFFYSLWIFLACVQRPRRSSTIFFLYRGKSLLSETQGLFLNHLATIFFTSKTEIFSIVSINLSPLKRSWFYEAA